MSDRYYDTPIGRLPSVTTILSVINKPFLLPWVAKEAREATILAVWEWIINAWRTLHEVGQISFFELKEIITEAVKEYQRKQKTALDIGSFVHNCIECWYKLWEGSRVEYFAFIREYFPKYPQACEMLYAYFDCLRIHDIDVIESEQTVWHELGYAGTLDLVALIGRYIAIGDIKTSKQISWEYWLQDEAYARAYKMRSGEIVHKKFIIRLDKLKPGTFEFQIRDKSQEDFDAFLAAKTLWQRSKG